MTSTFILASCAGLEHDEDERVSETEQHAVAPCTAVALVTPTNNQAGQVGVAMSLSATATCPGTHEFQYWVKPTTQANWIIANSAFVPGAFDWVPPTQGAWNVTAVARSVGNIGYDVRANSRLVNITPAAPVNNPPVAMADSVSTQHGQFVTFDPRVNDSDPDNDPLMITSVTQGTNGAVTFTGSNVTYTPNAGFAGSDSFQYTISDGNGGSASATVSVSVLNVAPVASDDTATTRPNQSVTGNVLANDSDADGDTLTVTSNTNPTSGAVVVAANGDFTYTAGNTTGTDTFTYTISDGFGGTATATVTITITNGAPVATNDAFSVNQNASLMGNVLANDSDPDNDTLTVTSNTSPASGSLSIAANGDFTYTPNPGFAGTDGFTYTISDGFGGTATGTVTITVAVVVPGCTISIAGPAAGTFGQQLTLTATASCTTGTPEVRWFRKIGTGATQQVQAFGPSLTFDYVPNALGSHTFTAEVRTQGTTTPTAQSNAVVMNIDDNVPTCTSVKLTAPVPGSSHAAGSTVTLTAQATCPAGTSVEYQYWFKSASSSTWTIIGNFTSGSGTWTAPAAGPYDLTAVARAVGAHVTYQVRANSIRVNVQ